MRPATSVAQVKRKSHLKAKAQASSSKKDPSDSYSKGGSVLGGIDYVTLMMGGRRKAQGEIDKMVED